MSVPPLLTRLPERIFVPLGSKNRKGYWALLCHLYRKKFGPDAPLPPSHGFAQREILREVEDFLRHADAWQPEDDETPSEATPDGRAQGIFAQLVDTGWLRLERHGLEKTITMSPIVGQLLGQLVAFAETGPVFVSGKIRSIDAAISQVLAGEGSGDLLGEAAEQCRNLLIYIRNTGTNVRDLMSEITAQQSTASYVRRFFLDYISEVFIGDYQELRTRDHPLSRRTQILEAVDVIDAVPTHRARLLDWYVNKRCSGNQEKGAALFERDLYRLRELDRVEEYLDRLDDEIRTANRRALAYLDYKLRSTRPIDQLLQFAIARVNDASCKGATVGAPLFFGPDQLMAGARLLQPKEAKRRPDAEPLRKTVISDRSKAIGSLARKAQKRRTVSIVALHEYAQRALSGKASVAFEQLPAQTLEELRAIQVLAFAAMGGNARNPLLQRQAARTAPGLDLRYTSDQIRPSDHLTTKPFSLEIRKRKAS